MWAQWRLIGFFALVFAAGMALWPSSDGLKADQKGAASSPAGSSPAKPVVKSDVPKELAVDLGNGVKLELVLIQPGTFTMGRNGNGKDDASPAHQVTLAKPFWIGKYEVTQEQWKQVMGTDFVTFFKGPKNPVDSITWEECQPLLDKLNQLVPGGGFRLPTEAEWEYACRAGSTDEQCCGTNYDEFAWYNGNSRGSTHPVGQKKPNAWGLYDMHGNVMEWCSDFYGPYTADAQTDPKGPDKWPGDRRQVQHVQRSGGCYPYDAWMPPSGSCADRSRGDHSWSQRNKLFGLRIARSAE